MELIEWIRHLVSVVVSFLATVDWKLYAGPAVALLVGLLVFAPTVARIRMDRRVETYKLFLEVSARIRDHPGDPELSASMSEQVASQHLLSWLTRRYRWLRDPGRRLLDEQVSWLTSEYNRIRAELTRHVGLHQRLDDLRIQGKVQGLAQRETHGNMRRVVRGSGLAKNVSEFEDSFERICASHTRARRLRDEAVSARNRARGRRYSRQYWKMPQYEREELPTGAVRIKFNVPDE